MSADFQKLASRWDSTFNSGDMTGLSKFYANDGSVVPAGGTPIDGSAGIAEFFGDLRAKGFAEHRIDVAKVVSKGETAIATGTWQLNGPGDNGTTQLYSGNWINVLAREGQNWRIVLHSWN